MKHIDISRLTLDNIPSFFNKKVYIVGSCFSVIGTLVGLENWNLPSDEPHFMLRIHNAAWRNKGKFLSCVRCYFVRWTTLQKSFKFYIIE